MNKLEKKSLVLNLFTRLPRDLKGKRISNAPESRFVEATLLLTGLMYKAPDIPEEGPVDYGIQLASDIFPRNNMLLDLDAIADASGASILALNVLFNATDYSRELNFRVHTLESMQLLVFYIQCWKKYLRHADNYEDMDICLHDIYRAISGVTELRKKYAGLFSDPKGFFPSDEVVPITCENIGIQAKVLKHRSGIQKMRMHNTVQTAARILIKIMSKEIANDG